jgi:hypothetical protein
MEAPAAAARGCSVTRLCCCTCSHAFTTRARGLDAARAIQCPTAARHAAASRRAVAARCAAQHGAGRSRRCRSVPGGTAAFQSFPSTLPQVKQRTGMIMLLQRAAPSGVGPRQRSEKGLEWNPYK